MATHMHHWLRRAAVRARGAAAGGGPGPSRLRVLKSQRAPFTSVLRRQLGEWNLRSFSTAEKPKEPEGEGGVAAAGEEEEARESWMYVDERIKPKTRSMVELVDMDWPTDDAAERAYVGEFMRAGRDQVREQEKLKAIKPFLSAKLREGEGLTKGGIRRMRKDGQVPGLVFGRTKNHNYAPVPVTVELKEITKQIRHHQESFFVTIFRMTIEGRPSPILVKPQQIQLHPTDGTLLSMSFVRWSPGKKTRITVPIEVIGTRDCVGVKNGGAVVRPTRSVKCVYDGPGPLPRKFQLNVQDWDVGHKFYAKDLEMPENTRLRREDIAHSQVLITILK